MAGKRDIYVIGHKNPDTDSICSAISYAYLKGQMDKDNAYVPKRAGEVSAETQYVLDYFGVEAPAYLDNIGSRVKDIESRKVEGAPRNLSLKNAWAALKGQNAFTLPILDNEKHVKGLITTNDLARSYMEDQDEYVLSRAKTPYKNIIETLDATMVVGDENAVFDHGKVIVSAANPDVAEKYIDSGDLVILGNRYESQLSSIVMGAGCLIVCLDADVADTIVTLAKQYKCIIIKTPLSTYDVARLINQSIMVEYFMKKTNLLTFHERDLADKAKEVMSKIRHRDFPVLNKKDEYVGMISRRNLLEIHKRKVIMVDHNEIAQAVDNIEEANVVEVIDHHKIGSMETVQPIFFRNQPLGCTATIIFQMFMENAIEIPKEIAGLLCAAILSDTLAFRSPTCTPMDIGAARALAKIAEINCCEDLAKDMFTAGSDLKSLTAEEIFYRDFKKFDIGDLVVGVGQITSVNDTELKEVKPRLLEYFDKVQNESNMDTIVFMLTNILEESSELLCVGEKAQGLIDLIQDRITHHQILIVFL